MSLDIIVWGKKGCGKCDKAKEKLVHMDMSFSYKDAEKYFHEADEDWRTDGRVEAKALYCDNNEEALPIISIRHDSEKHTAYLYGEAMKVLRKLSKMAS